MRRQVILFLISTLLMLFPLSGGSVLQQSEIAAQTPRATGVVVDTGNEPIIGASVMVKGAKTGTVTDMDGRFGLEAADNATLVVSYIGYVTQEVKFAKGRPMRVVLKEDVHQINEVVITALGIKRDRKALGYSLGEVKGEELQKAKEVNVVNSLAGKVAGLTVSKTATGPAGSTRVILRGSTELTGNNQPLYVVDGVPMDNTNFDSSDQWGGFDLGDGISSINPDDIESLSVLKGPAASALYGLRTVSFSSPRRKPMARKTSR